MAPRLHLLVLLFDPAGPSSPAGSLCLRLRIDWKRDIFIVKEKQMEGLTEKQEAVYQYIKVFIESNGWPPSMAEIGQHFAICSSVVKNTYLSALERKGYIQTISGKARAIRILK